MKRLVGLSLLLLYAACQKPGDEKEICDDAQAHLEECGLADDEPETTECTERQECLATCIVEASCEELDKPDPEGSYIECMVDCERKRPGENSSCQDAIQRLKSCQVDTSGLDPATCTAADACVATCINAASCTDIVEEDPESEYRACLLDC